MIEISPIELNLHTHQTEIVPSLSFEISNLIRCVDARRIGFERSARGIIGLVVEYIVAIDVTRVRFPDDAFWVILSFVIL